MKFSDLIALAAISLALVASSAFAHSPGLPPPVDCESYHLDQATGIITGSACSVSNYQGTWPDRSPCSAASAAFPVTESDVVAAVASAVQSNTPVKVVTEIGHSLTKISCPGGDGAGLVISLQHFAPDVPVRVNTTTMTATVPASMQLRDFVRQLAVHGVTIPHTILWDGVSVGGVIATGSHGSGFYADGSVMSNYVAAVRMVVPATAEDGYARVLTISESDVAAGDGEVELIKAARVSLGVLGVVTEVTFRVMPMFKRSLTVRTESDDDLEDRIVQFSKAHDFSSMFWVPSTGKVLLKEEDAVSVETEGDGANLFPLLQPMPASRIRAMRAHQEEMEKQQDVDALCSAGEKMMAHRVNNGDGFVNSLEEGKFKHFPVVGYNHHMQTTGGCQVIKNKKPCMEELLGKKLDQVQMSRARNIIDNNTDWWTCKWDPRLVSKDGEAGNVFYHHIAIAIPLDKAPFFVEDMKKLREANPKGMCSLNMFGGIHIRFMPGSSNFTYLGESGDSAVFELVYYRAREAHQPHLYQDIVEELEQILLLKYGGKPHWGKNRHVTFFYNQNLGDTKSLISNLPRFLQAKKILDPNSIFSNPWSDHLLGIKPLPSLSHDNCAIDGICFCSEDHHCAPEHGYTCQRGLVLKEARVCRYNPSTIVSTHRTDPQSISSI